MAAPELLFDAVFYGKVDEVYRLVFADANVRAENAAGNQCVHAAAHAGQTRILEILLRAGASVVAAGRAGNTPLHYACKEGHLDAVRLLLRLGADPALKNFRGQTARDVAAHVQREAVVAALDVFVLDRCSFLPSEGEGKGARKGEGDAGTGTGTRSETGQRSDSAATDPGRRLLAAVKPMMTRQHSRLLQPAQPEAAALGEGVQEGVAPEAVWGHNEAEEDTEEEEEEETREETVVPPKARGRGYHLDVDGEQVWVSLEEEENGDGDGDDDGDGDGDEDEDEDEVEVSDEKGAEAEVSENHGGQIATPAAPAVLVTQLSPGPRGLGMLLSEGGQVCDLDPGGPATSAGVCVGDVLKSVNGSSTEGLLLRSVLSLIAAETELEHTVELAFDKSQCL